MGSYENNQRELKLSANNIKNKQIKMMSRYEHRHKKGKKRIFPTILITIAVVLAVIIISLYIYAKSTIVIEKPRPNLGKKVKVYLPNDKIVYTYEYFIVHEGNKIYYEGERNKIDLTGGEVVYEDWE